MPAAAFNSMSGKNRSASKPMKCLKLFDIGDIVGIKGQVFKTHAGEITVFCCRDHHCDQKSCDRCPRQTAEKKRRKNRLTTPLPTLNSDIASAIIDLNVNPQVREVFIKRFPGHLRHARIPRCAGYLKWKHRFYNRSTRRLQRDRSPPTTTLLISLCTCASPMNSYLKTFDRRRI